MSRKQNIAAPAYVEMPADTIDEPGCYVCNWNGHVLRIPAEAGQTRRSMMISIVGSRPLTVTRVSENAYLPLSEARQRASQVRGQGTTVEAADAVAADAERAASAPPARPASKARRQARSGGSPRKSRKARKSTTAARRARPRRRSSQS